jgi:hypothetical protein
MIRAIFVGIVSLGVSLLAIAASHADEIRYPQVIKTRFEAVDQKNGGQFVLWSERERIYYGLDPKLYPAARFVEVVQLTPAAGSVTLTFVEVRTITAQTSDYLYLTGNLRFRVSGMVLKSSNFPPDTNMSVKPAE